MAGDELEDTLEVEQAAASLLPGLPDRDGPDQPLRSGLIEVRPGEASVGLRAGFGCADPDRYGTGPVVEQSLGSGGCGVALRGALERFRGIVRILHDPHTDGFSKSTIPPSEGVSEELDADSNNG